MGGEKREWFAREKKEAFTWRGGNRLSPELVFCVTFLNGSWRDV